MEKVLWKGHPPMGGCIVRTENGDCEIRTPGGLVGNLGRVLFIQEIEEQERTARTQHLTIRFTPEELSAVRQKAQEVGLDVSTYIRAVLLAQ